MSDNQQLQQMPNQIIEGRVIGGVSDVKTLTKAIIKNYISQVPIVGPGISGVVEYYQEKVSQRRAEEVDVFLENLDNRLSSVEIKQEAIDYFESSLMFRLEEIQQKLLSNPGKGFDEVLADFVANALMDLSFPPEAKDLILSTLLSLDSVDLMVFKQLDLQWMANLKSEKPEGVKRDILKACFASREVDSIMINRSLQRLEAQYLIRPLTSNRATIQEMPSLQDLVDGKVSPQYDSVGGLVTTDFGRRFLTFLKLSN